MARLTEDQKEQIVADFHVGKSQNELAKKYEVSPATINKLCKGLAPKHLEKVNTLTRINTELAAESECQVNAIHREVDERTRHLAYFNDASYRVTEKALRILDEKDDISPADVRHVSEVVAKQREGVLGKAPDVAVNINNQATNGRPSPERVREILGHARRIEDID